MKTILASLTLALASTVIAGAAQFSVTFLPDSSLTYPADHSWTWGDSTFTSQTADPSGPFSNIPCNFLGSGVGGSQEEIGGKYLVYRIRLDFDEDVILNSFTEIGAGHQVNNSFLRILRTNMVQLSSNALPDSINTLVTNQVVANSRGRSFIIDEFDSSPNVRYRERFAVTFTPIGAPLTIQVASVAISWPSEANKFYQVEYSTALAPNTWFALGSPVQGNGTTNTFVDPVLGQERRFYRALTLP